MRGESSAVNTSVNSESLSKAFKACVFSVIVGPDLMCKRPDAMVMHERPDGLLGFKSKIYNNYLN